jgi:hypothetical protein
MLARLLMRGVWATEKRREDKYMFIVYCLKVVKASRASRGQGTMKALGLELLMCTVFAPRKRFIFCLIQACNEQSLFGQQRM